MHPEAEPGRQDILVHPKIQSKSINRLEVLKSKKRNFCSLLDNILNFFIFQLYFPPSIGIAEAG